MFRRIPQAPSFAVAYPSAREIAARLKGETRPDGSGNYACHCPGPMHKNGDANPSLSVKDGASGRPLLFASRAAISATLSPRSNARAFCRGAGDEHRGSRPAHLAQRRQLKGSVVEAYYAWRGLAVPKTENLRFVASLLHKSGASYPAIIARVEDLTGLMTGDPADLSCA